MKDQGAVAIYEIMGGKMEKKLQDLRGETTPKHLETVFVSQLSHKVPNTYYS